MQFWDVSLRYFVNPDEPEKNTDNTNKGLLFSRLGKAQSKSNRVLRRGFIMVVPVAFPYETRNTYSK